MFVQTEITPNPNSLKFLPGKIVSKGGSFEITKKDDVKNELIRNIMAINGVEGVFLNKDFISINKYDETSWDDIKHIVISLINDFYSSGKEFIIDKNPLEPNENLGEIEKKIDYGKDGYIDFTNRRDMEPTIFSIYGNKIFLILILLYIFLIFSFNRIKNE